VESGDKEQKWEAGQQLSVHKERGYSQASADCSGAAGTENEYSKKGKPDGASDAKPSTWQRVGWEPFHPEVKLLIWKRIAGRSSRYPRTSKSFWKANKALETTVSKIQQAVKQLTQ
jgi:hypothetical protein